MYYTYDGKGRLDRFYSSDNTLSYQYFYNKEDDLTQVLDLLHNTSTERKFNAQHQLQFEKLDNGLKIEYEHDNLGRKTKVILPDQSCIDYIYDAANLREICRNGYSHQYVSFDQNGNVLESKLPLQAGVISYTYDKLNRARTIHHPKRSHKIPLDGFDKAGNLLKFQVTESQITKEHNFNYDDLYQLTKEDGHEAHVYAYDSLNNRISKDGNDCANNDLNQLLNQEELEFKYDLNGNIIEKKNGDKIFTYKYDALNRLTAIQTPEKLIIYRYDSFDRRLSKNEENYLYDGQNQIANYKNHTQTALRVLGTALGAEIGGTVSIEIADQIYVPLHDHNGNIVKLLSTDGSEYKTYQYTAFGLELEPDKNDPNPWRYASKFYDSETGFIYFGRRYYDPEIARWIGPDPSEYEDGPNLYGYLHNNPLNHYDAYGLWGEQASERMIGYSEGLFSLGKFGDSYRESINRFCDKVGLEHIAIDPKPFNPSSKPFNELSPREQGRFAGKEVVDCVLGCFPTFLEAQASTAILPALNIFKKNLNELNSATNTLVRNSNYTKMITGRNHPNAGLESKLSTNRMENGASNANANVALKTKLSQLEKAQNVSVDMRELPDGRIRYFKAEKPSANEGPTRGSCHVLEWNPKTGNTKSWHESRDHFGSIVRVHPKSINGQNLNSQHYPPTGAELKRWNIQN